MTLGKTDYSLQPSPFTCQKLEFDATDAEIISGTSTTNCRDNCPVLKNITNKKSCVKCKSQARPLLSQALENGNFKELVDPRLETNYNPDEMIHMTACAATCVRQSARLRPRMSQVSLRSLLICLSKLC